MQRRYKLDGRLSGFSRQALEVERACAKVISKLELPPEASHATGTEIVATQTEAARVLCLTLPVGGWPRPPLGRGRCFSSSLGEVRAGRHLWMTGSISVKGTLIDKYAFQKIFRVLIKEQDRAI